MKLNYAAPMDLVAASTYGAWIVSPKALDGLRRRQEVLREGHRRRHRPVHDRRYTAGNEVVLKAYDGLLGRLGRRPLRDVDVSITPEAVTAQQMLTSGEVDYATSVPAENLET